METGDNIDKCSKRAARAIESRGPPGSIDRGVPMGRWKEGLMFQGINPAHLPF